MLLLALCAMLSACGGAPTVGATIAGGPGTASAIRAGATPSAASTAPSANAAARTSATGTTSTAGRTATAATPAAQPTAIPRTGGPRDIILSTTTSTQDSGLLDALIPRFEAQTGYRVKVVAVGSGAALALGQRGEADVVLAHAPDNERQFVASGVGIERRLVMYNDFIIVGPAADPATIGGSTDALDALKRIAASGSPFIGRGDNSGTQQLELALWKLAGIAPQGQPWYTEAGAGMGQTLQIADQRRAYTLADRATYLAFQSKIRLPILVERDERLLNVYHVILVAPARFPAVNAAGARAFADFILAPDTQRFIGQFGIDKYGQPLFTPCAGNGCGLREPGE
jgi:tungstate transport system substrate-binding protein